MQSGHAFVRTHEKRVSANEPNSIFRKFHFLESVCLYLLYNIVLVCQNTPMND